MVADEDLARVKAASDLVAIVSEHVALKRVGRHWMGPCPFHAERTTSFAVNGELGVYYCFGCGARGDVVTFVAELEHLDLAAAVERLAARAGISLSRAGTGRARLVEAVRAAVDWYHQRLLAAPDAGRARAWLRSRGYDREVLERFRLGWAPDERDALARALALPDDVLRDAGLGFVSRAGRRRDAFRARVMFPIFDVHGDPVAFGGRALGGTGPKYKNSPETPLWAKSRTLYGLDRARGEITATGEVVVCEGYTDVIGFALAGVGRAVATCGTALTDGHLRTLANLARRVVLAYDADAAGQAAAERAGERARRLGLDVAVAELPAGTDPAEVARADPAALRDAVATARPFAALRVERAIRRCVELHTPEERARAVHAALEAITEHADDSERDRYVMALADRCRMDVRLLRSLTPTPRRTCAPHAPPTGLPRTAEESALVLALHDPASVSGRLHESLFTDPVARAAWRALAGGADPHAAISSADPEVGALLARLAVTEPDADAGDVVAVLVMRAVTAALARCTAAARSAADPAAWAPVTARLARLACQLRDPTARDRAAADYVALRARPPRPPNRP